MLGLHLRQDAPFKDLEKISVLQVKLWDPYILGEKHGKWNRKYPKKQVCFALVFNRYFGVAIPRSLFISAKFKGEQKVVNIK